MPYQGEEWYSAEECERLAGESPQDIRSMARFLQKHLNLAFRKGHQIGWGESAEKCNALRDLIPEAFGNGASMANQYLDSGDVAGMWKSSLAKIELDKIK